MKKCGYCGCEKEIDQFSKNKHGKDGRYSICRQCRKEKSSVRYVKNKDQISAKANEWQQSNYDRHRENVDRWRSENVFKARQHMARFRAKLLGLTEHFSPDELSDVFIRQSGVCSSCGSEMHDFHVDHIVPLSRGGNNKIHNIQILCPSCNQKKRNLLPDEWEKIARNTG